MRGRIFMVDVLNKKVEIEFSFEDIEMKQILKYFNGNTTIVKDL